MLLATEDLGEFPDVTAEAMDELLATDGFGKFAILSKSDTVFIQTACEWEPGPTSQTFLEKHDSDPWILQYRDESGKQYQAKGQLTLKQVRQAFASYHAGKKTWQTTCEWELI